MKVTTDACLFGAIVANEANNNNFGTDVLDIGTGTGLLSLMFAQKNPLAKIDAVEIDTHAAAQAKSNIDASIFANQIQAYKADIKTFTIGHLYDFVFTNPPFFENDLKSINETRNIALHDESLTLETLIIHIDRLLKPAGFFAILLPFHRVDYLKQQAALFQWYCFKQINIKQTENHPFFRSILFFSRLTNKTKTTELTIKLEQVYSDDFKSLLKDYYLFL